MMAGGAGGAGSGRASTIAFLAGCGPVSGSDGLPGKGRYARQVPNSEWEPGSSRNPRSGRPARSLPPEMKSASQPSWAAFWSNACTRRWGCRSDPVLQRAAGPHRRGPDWAGCWHKPRSLAGRAAPACAAPNSAALRRPLARSRTSPRRSPSKSISSLVPRAPARARFVPEANRGWFRASGGPAAAAVWSTRKRRGTKES